MVDFDFDMMRDMIDFAVKSGLMPSHWNMKRTFMVSQSKKDPLEYWVEQSFSGLSQKFNLYRFHLQT